MIIVNRKVLIKCAEKHADARSSLYSWLDEAKAAHWKMPQDIKKYYPSASILPGNQVLFNIKGNRYRLDVIVAYDTGVVYIKWAGPHAEYDKMEFK